MSQPPWNFPLGPTPYSNTTPCSLYLQHQGSFFQDVYIYPTRISPLLQDPYSPGKQGRGVISQHPRVTVFFFLTLGSLLSSLFLSRVIPQLSLFLEGPNSQIPKYRTRLHFHEGKCPSEQNPLLRSLLLVRFPSMLCLATPGPLYWGFRDKQPLPKPSHTRTSFSSSHPYPGQDWRWAHGGLERDGGPSAVGERPAWRWRRR